MEASDRMDLQVHRCIIIRCTPPSTLDDLRTSRRILISYLVKDIPLPIIQIKKSFLNEIPISPSIIVIEDIPTRDKPLSHGALYDIRDKIEEFIQSHYFIYSYFGDFEVPEIFKKFGTARFNIIRKKDGNLSLDGWFVRTDRFRLLVSPDTQRKFARE